MWVFGLRSAFACYTTINKPFRHPRKNDFWICLKVGRENVLKLTEALSTALEVAEAHYIKKWKSLLNSTFSHYIEEDDLSILPRKRRRLQRGLKERTVSPIAFEQETSEPSAAVQTDDIGRNLPLVRTLKHAIPVFEPADEHSVIAETETFVEPRKRSRARWE